MLDQCMSIAYHFKTAKASYSRIRHPYFIGHLTLVKLFSLLQALVGVLGSGIRNDYLRQSFQNICRELECVRPNVSL